MADSVEIGPQKADGSGDAVDLARALVATPSVNPALEASGTGEEASADLAAGWLRGWGFDVRRVDTMPGRPSVLARLERGAGRSLILSGHLDTVGVEGMTVEPFGADIRDGRLWGRGAADMKGGVAAALAAARDAAREGFDGTLIVALTADEEDEARGAHELVDGGLRADAAIVCEPTGLDIMPAHKGFTWLELVFRGRAAHGSRPDRGVDAIRHAGLLLSRLGNMSSTLKSRDRHPLLGFGSVHAGTIRGGTALSVYPASCTLTLERRTLPGETGAAFRTEVEYALGELRSKVPQLEATAEVTLHRNASEIPVDHELVGAMGAAARGAGLRPEVAGMTAWVEAMVFNESGTPALCFGPGGIGDAHAPDESVDIEDIRSAHRALTNLVRRFLA